MKKIIIIFLTVLTLLCFSLPASAKTVDDLKTIYQSMTTYIYPDYYQNSPSYGEFGATISELNSFINSGDQTQANIDSLYQKIRQSYVKLMKETFDYHSLEQNLAIFEKLNSSIFTSESWEKLLAAKAKVDSELFAPTLFSRGSNTDFASFSKVVQNHIESVSNEFINAYQSLEINLPETNVSRQQFDSFVYYMEIVAPEKLMQSAPSWNEYNTVYLQMADLITWRNPAQWRLDDGSKALWNAYLKLIDEVVTFDSVTEEIARFNATDATRYTSNSFQRYKAAVEEMSAKADFVPYLYFPLDEDSATLSERIQAISSTLSFDAETAYNQLITVDKYNQMIALCNEYTQRFPKKEGLELQYDALKNAIDHMMTALSAPETIPTDLDSLAVVIETKGAEYEIALNRSNVVVPKAPLDNSEHVQRIVYALGIALILSAAFALVLSYRRYGRILWNR